MDLNLNGKVAVVTGASKGIGLSITRTLLAEGAHVVAVSRKFAPGLEGAVHVAVDLMDPEAPGQAIERAVAEFGGLDVLVNNAGGPPPGVSLPRSSFMDATDEEWRLMYEFNLFSAVRAIRAAIPHMLARGAGSIVNVSSGNARQPTPMTADYGTAKAAMNNLTKVLSAEYGPQGIRVNTVSPGVVRTAWWLDEGGVADQFAAQAGVARDVVMDEMVPQMLNLSIPRFVEPQEIADMVALLASPRSGSTTGAEFVVDSGQLKEL
ncbi:SDR family NAD(P)-dependent oxidoreductase [Nonomuraea sp. NPDC050556]|uniref:SDR family NAD(P)-dependent oxidoreductase n=1 Tax=Nonomuraea sp. NPDC050556 TaxID=3364369 RepID=UPI0037988DA1